MCVHMGAVKFVAAFAFCAALAARAADFVPEDKTGAAIQKAIDAAFAAGGGRVALEKGAVYESATIRLKSRVELNVPEGTVILGSSNPDDYGSVSDSRGGQKGMKANKVFIACADSEDVAITGKGTIDAQGVKYYDVNTVLWGRFYDKPKHQRTRLLAFFNCRNVRFEDITFKDSPSWTTWIRRCENVTAERVKICADQRIINSDGFHIDSCRHVRIRNCDIRTGDDCIVMRAIREPGGEFLVCEDMVVEDCMLNSACQCVRLSCPSDGLIRNGVFRRLKMSGHNGVLSGHPAHYLLKGERGSAKMENILVEDCDIDVDASAILFKVDPEVSLPGFGNVTFRDIRLKSKYALLLQGTDKAILRNIRFENVSGTVEAKTPLQVSCVEGLAFDRFNVTCGLAGRPETKD